MGERMGLQKGSLTPKYLDLCSTVLLAIFTTGLIFARQLKQGAATLWGMWSERVFKREPHTPKYFGQFLMVLLATFTTGLIYYQTIKTRGSNPIF